MQENIAAKIEKEGDRAKYGNKSFHKEIGRFFLAWKQTLAACDSIFEHYKY